VIAEVAVKTASNHEKVIFSFKKIGSFKKDAIISVTIT